MKIKFLADVNLSAAIVEAVLRLEASIDFQTHRITGLDRRADPEVLRIAADTGRLLVTHDRNTMPAHFRRFVPEQDSPGIIVVPQRMRVKFVAEDLLLMWAASDLEEWQNRIV
jgi:predicted nuclease of predicted toxin-antitoxin system